jgi:hypothetical protein
MPKRRADVLHGVRIELNKKERELLEAVAVGNTIKNVGMGVGIPVAVVAASYLSYKSLKEAWQWGEDIVTGIPTYYEKLQESITGEDAPPVEGTVLENVGRYVLAWTTGYGLVWGKKV